MSREDATEAIKKITLTRRTIISKIAEFFDPLGIWEPLKLQLKLHASRLNQLLWDKPLDKEEQKNPCQVRHFVISLSILIAAGSIFQRRPI